jgi:site-specific recombinase XerD
VSSNLDKRFKNRGLLPSTQEKYGVILSAVESDDPLHWLNKRIEPSMPIGTVLPLRAAVKHYLIAEKGYSEEELDALLPKAKGRQPRWRQALSPDALALYHGLVDAVSAEPVHTILSLLPATGMRIGEITTLRVEDLREVGGRYYFSFYGKGDKPRVVPLSLAGEKALKSYMEFSHPTNWLFPGRSGNHITQHAVRKYTRKMATAHVELEGLSPHVLRHTAATLWLRKGADIRQVQALLGHQSIVTTQRYTHPDVEMLVDVVDRADTQFLGNKATPRLLRGEGKG